MELRLDEADFDFDSGSLCLDFANTADWHASEEPQERLDQYTDLLLWGWAANLLNKNQAQDLLQAAENQPQAAVKVYERAIQLREVLYRIFSQTAGQELPRNEDLAFFNSALQNVMPHLRLINSAEGFVLHWQESRDALDRMLWPVIQSAVDLLTSGDLDRVGECADDRGCGYLYLDTSRNRSRRWCSMESCGNRAKAMRHYGRQHES
jgi:predicted RNA-binding Zn ribbon-like protein